MSADHISLIAVGDIAPDREDPATCFDRSRHILKAHDIGFCQLEMNLTERGSRLPQARHAVRGKPSIAPALVNAGLEVVSVAGNHCLDWGQESLQDTLDNLRKAHARPVGAGHNILAARQRVIVERKGLRVAFLAYCSILPQNYWADELSGGCAPMRAFTHYEQIEHDQPGTPARIQTFPHRGDLIAMQADIRAAREQADSVIVSHHWGIHFVPAVVADYQRDVGYAAIEAGADAVLGHHAHILKGVEFHLGKPIFYSLGNFAIDLWIDKAHAESKSFKEIQSLNPDWVVDFDSAYNFPPASRRSIAVKLNITKKGLMETSILPVWIDRDAVPEFPKPGDPHFAEVVNYMREISLNQGFATRFESKGEEVIVTEG